MAHIKTYARIKPTSKPSDLLDHEPTNVSISVPQLQPSSTLTRAHAPSLTHQFSFAEVFGPTSTQDEVFDSVASHIVDGFLSGYNGTIFAYGQTGSGKTYTIEGGAKSYSDRGLAPRALSRIYKSLENLQYDELSIKVSYLEMYQEVGYDLLNPTTRPGHVVTHLPKVNVTDGPNNSCVVRNLTLHLAADERVAQSLLLQGQMSRKVAETPMNQRSSRSHAVFTIYMKAKQKGSYIKSKLHLVDLAGSERVAKTKIAGQQLHEAKSINLSLHHLEGVIIALQGGEKHTSKVKGRRRAMSAGPVRNRRIGSASSTRSLPYHRSMSTGGQRHIPYRNSLLTMVLRDSLGGNCLTAMIATVSAEAFNLSESLSTCRFAMRVAAIQNKVSRNEVMDDRTVIARLRRKISSLEEEIRNLKSTIDGGKHVKENSHEATHQHQSDPSQSSMKASSSLANTPIPVVAPANGRSGLTREEKQLCAKIMHGFISGRLVDPVASGVIDFSRFRECLRILREMIHTSYAYHQRYNPTLPSDPKHSSKVNKSDEHPQDTKRSTEDASVKGRSRSSSEKALSKSYRSPFEKKREKDINRLGKNIETQIANQKQQRQDLMEFKTLLKQQQLENAVQDLSTKILMTTSHLEKQQELVENLRQCKAGREQITAERIAEKQLAKRLSKYEKRYELALEHLQIVKNHLELQGRVTKARQSTNQNSFTRQSSSQNSYTRKDFNNQSEEAFHHAGKPSSPRRVQGDANIDQSEVVRHQSGVEGDQSGSFTERLVERCRQKSGKVDARKVLDLLQQEDSKHNKVAKEIKKERIKNFTQHFTLKEEATLTKLQHFKEQLRKQQEAERGKSDHHALSMRRSCDSHVTSAWCENEGSTEQPTKSESEIPISTAGESDFATDDVGQAAIGGRHVNTPPMRHQESFVLQRSSKVNPLHHVSSKNYGIAIQDCESPESNDKAAVVDSFCASDKRLDRSPVEKSPVRSMTRTAVSTEDPVSLGGSTVSVQSSKDTLGSISSPFAFQDSEITSREHGFKVYGQDKSLLSVSSGHSSAEVGLPTGGYTEEAGLPTGDYPAADGLLTGGYSTENGLPSGGNSGILPETPGSPEPCGLPVTDPRRSSFDTALSSMLRGDRSNVKLGIPTLGDPEEHRDATSALKSKLLEYLDSKPSTGSSLTSMSSLQDDWSINSGYTESSIPSYVFKGSSLDHFHTGSVLKSASVNSALTDPSIKGTYSQREDSSPQLMSHTLLAGRDSKTNTVSPSKTPSFKMDASSSTLNSIGEEESILVKGKGEVSRDDFNGSHSFNTQEELGNFRSGVKAMDENEGQRSYLSAAKENKERIEKIRKVMSSVKVIQRAWKKYRSQRKGYCL